jgi:hypothetical protein
MIPTRPLASVRKVFIVFSASRSMTTSSALGSGIFLLRSTTFSMRRACSRASEMEVRSAEKSRSA